MSTSIIVENAIDVHGEALQMKRTDIVKLRRASISRSTMYVAP